MTLQVLAPGMPHVLSEGFHAQDNFRITLGKTLLLRTSLHNETLDTAEVVGCGKPLQEPDDRVFIGKMIILCSAQWVISGGTFVHSRGYFVCHQDCSRVIPKARARWLTLDVCLQLRSAHHPKSGRCGSKYGFVVPEL